MIRNINTTEDNGANANHYTISKYRRSIIRSLCHKRCNVCNYIHIIPLSAAVPHLRFVFGIFIIL